MRLPLDQAQRFMALYVGLIGWCARRRDPKSAIRDAASFRAASALDKGEARDRVFDEPDLIGEYVAENPDHLEPEDLALVGAWRVFRRGDFVIERDLKRYTVFLDWKRPPVAYGALSLIQELVDIVPIPLPVLVHAVLLPWKGAIVCDGLLGFSNVHLGPGIRREVADAYREAKARGIVTSLDGATAPAVDDPRASATKAPHKGRARPSTGRTQAPDPKRAFIGRWRIVDEDDGPAFIEVGRSGQGSLELGLVVGELDGRFSLAGDYPLMEFTWEGHDEDEPVCGRGRMQIDASGAMRGRIFVHMAKELEVVARKVKRGGKRGG